MPEDRRDLALSQTAREAVIAAITADAPAADPGGLPSRRLQVQCSAGLG